VHPWWRDRCQNSANSTTQSAYLFPVHAMFRHDCPPSCETCKYATAPSTKKKLGEILCLLICSFLSCLSWLLRSRVRKSRRDLRITLYIGRTVPKGYTRLRDASIGRCDFQKVNTCQYLMLPTHSYCHCTLICSSVYSINGLQFYQFWTHNI
jgi:hypothetical protein